MEFPIRIVRILISLCTFCWVWAHDPTIFTYCSKDYIKVRVIVNPNFFGIVYANDRDGCSSLGTGDKNVFLYIPLLEPGTSAWCGVVQDQRGWSTIVRVQAHTEVETTKDSVFLVQCSQWDLEAKKARHHLPVSLQLTRDGNPVPVAIVGQKYTVQITLPSGAMHRIGSCLAFSGNRISDMTPLLDDEGCAIGDMMSSFRSSTSTNTYTADLTMFRFNGTHEFHMQCAIVQCFGRCPPPSCLPSKSGQLITNADSDVDPDTQMVRAGSVSKRIFVSDVPPRIEHIKKPCIWSEDTPLIGLSVLLATLVLLTVATCASAIKNRPCRCHFDVRDSPTNERFSRLSEEATSVRFRPNIRPPPDPMSTQPSNKATSQVTTSKSTNSAIRAYETSKRRPDLNRSDIRSIRIEKPACCQAGKSMDELPQAPLPDEPTHNLDRLVESSLKKLKAMLPSVTDEDVSSSAYRHSGIKDEDKGVETESTDHHLYETPTGCMLSTLF